MTDAGPTVAEIAGKWPKLRAAEVKRGDVAPSTVRDNGQHLETHILPMLGELPVKALSEGPARLRQFIADLRAKPKTRKGKDGKREPIEGSRLSNNTVRNVGMTLSKMLGDAQAEQWVELAANPMQHGAVKLPRAETLSKGAVIFVERAAVEALLRDPRIDRERRQFYLLAFLTGLDTGEIAGLSWEHVDLDAAVPVVRVTRCFQESGEHGATKRPDRVRTVPLHPLAATMLKARRAAQWVELVGRHAQQTDPAFPHEHGKPHYRHSAAPSLRADLKRVGCSSAVGGHPITMKSTRRSFATWLYEAGIEASSVA